MRISLPLTISCGLALTTLNTLTVARGTAVSSQTSPTADAAPAALFDPQQFPAVHGELERLTLTGRGDVDGFIFKDGTEVKVAPDLARQILSSIKPGDQVTVHGLKAAALTLIRAVSITDESTHRTLSDASIAANGAPPRLPALATLPVSPHEESDATGKIRMLLHGAQGEVNGVLLESGAILRFPPDQTRQWMTGLQPHQTIIAQGVVTTTGWGTVMEVRRIGNSRDRLVSVEPGPGPVGDGRPANARREPPPPPGPLMRVPFTPPPPTPPST